ncbi:lipopolysaccharide biosynthesis protein [Leclercia sp. UBA5958]|uniref:lipopolysaccharide biosynthesis protein n=1 Tax=Leclercia sp. UBA5958 TaxID=1946742 RepID=UPI00257C534B|nr:lipopolysaccharide biosynthesis protein [Leclercia sp. UBA5958]
MTLFSNAKWVSISQFGKILIQLLSLTILTRFIPPEDYGLMALATVVLNFVLIIRDLGTASAIIQRKEIDNDILNSVFWLNILMGAVLFIVVNALTPLIESFLANPKLGNILFLLCFCFPIASAGSAPQALMERNSKFKEVAIIELVSASAGFFVALLFAMNNGGVYALVSQIITNSLLSSFLLIALSSWRPSLYFDFKSANKILGFSGRLTVFNLVNYLSRNADSMIISRQYNATILGSYSLAYRIMLFPLQSLTFIASRSLYPVLSRNQDDLVTIRNIYLKTIFIISSLTIPMMLGLAVLREPFVGFALGENWTITASLLLWLAPTGIIQSILSCSGSILMSTNNAKTLMFLGIFSAILQISSFLIGSLFTIKIFAFSYFIANIINAFVVMYFTLGCIKQSTLGFLKVLAVPSLSGGIMFGCIYYLYSICVSARFNDFSILTILTIAGVIIYLMAFVCFTKVLVNLNVFESENLPAFVKNILKLR